MATPITWKNVSAPDFGDELLAQQRAGNLLGKAVEGLGTNVIDAAEAKRKLETDQFIADLNAAPDDATRNKMVSDAESGWLNLDRVNTAVTDAQTQDFKVAEEARAQLLSEDTHAASEAQREFDEKYRPKKLTKIDQEITRETAMQPLDTRVRTVEAEAGEFKQVQEGLKAPFEITKLEQAVEKQELENEEIYSRIVNNDNINQITTQKHLEWMQHHSHREKLALQNIKNAEFEHKKAKWELKNKKDLAPNEKLALENRLKLSAKQLKLAEMDFNNEERKIRNQGLVAQQLNQAMLKEGSKAQAAALLDAINENKGAKRPINDALLKTEYSHIINNDRSIELGYGEQGMKSATLTLDITDNKGNPVRGDKSFSGSNQQRLRAHLFDQVKEKYKGASAKEVEAHVDRMMRQSPYALQFTNRAALEAKGEDAQKKAEHNVLVSDLMNRLDAMDITKDSNGYRNALNNGIAELRNLDDPVSNEVLKRLGWHQEQALETSYFDGPKSAEALWGASLKMGADGKTPIDDFTAGNKLRLINTIDRIILNENRFASREARTNKRNEMLQNVPGLLTGYAAEGRKVTRSMEITELVGESAKNIVTDRLDVIRRMTSKPQGVKNYLVEELKKKFKADGEWDNVRVEKLSKEVFSTNRKIDNIFAGSGLSTNALNALKIAKHSLFLGTDVDWDGIRNDYQLTGLPEAEGEDMTDLENWQLIAGILYNLPPDASGQANFTAADVAALEKVALGKLKKDKYGLDATDGSVKQLSLIKEKFLGTNKKDVSGKLDDPLLDALDNLTGRNKGKNKSVKDNMTELDFLNKTGLNPDSPEYRAAFTKWKTEQRANK
jgi:hypothetical protein